MSTPLISIITINLNNAAGLEATLKSVTSQAFSDLEVIVIDGDSKDESSDVIQKYSSSIAFSSSEKDSGIYDAMNKGVKKATGKYLLFLNSGDYFLNNEVLATVAPLLKDSDVISGDITIEDKQGVTRICKSHEDVSLDFFLEISLYHQATFISRALFTDYGLYDASFKMVGDYEFFIRVFFKHNAAYQHIPHIISYFKEDGLSNNPEFLSLNKKECERAWLQNISPRSFQLLKEGQSFKSSTVYWLYHKTLKGGIYKSLLSFIYQVRVRIYRFMKNEH